MCKKKLKIHISKENFQIPTRFCKVIIKFNNYKLFRNSVRIFEVILGF